MDFSRTQPLTTKLIDNVQAAAAGAGDAEDAAGKQTRAQKKMMKAMSKLNLKHVPGIMKVVMRRKGNILFSIHGGEVYKVSREKPLRWKLVTFGRISWFLERILMEHIE